MQKEARGGSFYVDGDLWYKIRGPSQPKKGGAGASPQNTQEHWKLENMLSGLLMAREHGSILTFMKNLEQICEELLVMLMFLIALLEQLVIFILLLSWNPQGEAS